LADTLQASLNWLMKEQSDCLKKDCNHTIAHDVSYHSTSVSMATIPVSDFQSVPVTDQGKATSGSETASPAPPPGTLPSGAKAFGKVLRSS
jgi:hypothetical protein